MSNLHLLSFITNQEYYLTYHSRKQIRFTLYLELSVLLHVSEQRRFWDWGEVTLWTLKPLPWAKTKRTHFHLAVLWCTDLSWGSCWYLKMDNNMNSGKQSNRRSTSSLTVQRAHTFVGVTQSVALQRDFGFKLFTAQIAQVTPLCVVSVHVGLQVVPAAACVVAQAADIRLQTCIHGHKTYLGWTSMCFGHAATWEVSNFFISLKEKKQPL